MGAYKTMKINQTKRRGNSTLYFHDGIVTKVFNSEVESEYKKAVTMWELSCENEFLFPKPIGLNTLRKSIDFEFIKTKGSVRNLYLDFMMSSKVDCNKLDIFESCGKVLGEVHKVPFSNDVHKWNPPELFLEALAAIGRRDLCTDFRSFSNHFLHCDFGFENIEQVRSGDHELLVMFDPSPNYFTTFNSQLVGPIYVDIGNFLSGIEGLVPIKNYHKIKWKRLHHVREAFFAGYEESRGIKVDQKMSKAFSYASAYCYLSKKYKVSALRRIGLNLLFNKYKGNGDFK